LLLPGSLLTTAARAAPPVATNPLRLSSSQTEMPG